MNKDFETKKYFVEIDQQSNGDQILSERWRNQSGEFDRPADLPAFVNYCPDKGIPTYQRWHEPGGTQHRDGDKPALIVTNSDTEIVVHESYDWFGNCHRDGDKPAQIFREEDGAIKEEVYWRHGTMHRDPQLGPARVRYNPATGKVTEAEYWVKGRQISAPTADATLDI